MLPPQSLIPGQGTKIPHATQSGQKDLKNYNLEVKRLDSFKLSLNNNRRKTHLTSTRTTEHRT